MSGISGINEENYYDERYIEYFNFIPIPVFILNGVELKFINDFAIKHIGIDSINSYEGKSIFDFISIHPDSKEIYKKLCYEVSNQGKISKKDIKYIINKSGKIVEASMAITNINYKGNKVILILLSDLLEKRKIENINTEFIKAKEYEKIKNQFIVNITHELMTPLNLIINANKMNEIITNTEEKNIFMNKVSIYNGIIEENSLRLERLINNILDSTKIDLNYYPIEFKNYDIVNIVESTTLSVAEYLEDKGIAITFDTEIEEKYIACDPEKIQRIILNILSNAAKYTSKGGNIYVNIYDKSDKVLISIRDTGIGIPLDMQDKIFDKFSKVDKSLSRRSEGSGVGLFISKSLAKMHNGDVTVKSEWHKGSEFILELPNNKINDKDYIFCSPQDNNMDRVKLEFSDVYL